MIKITIWDVNIIITILPRIEEGYGSQRFQSKSL